MTGRPQAFRIAITFIPHVPKTLHPRGNDGCIITIFTAIRLEYVAFRLKSIASQDVRPSDLAAIWDQRASNYQENMSNLYEVLHDLRQSRIMLENKQGVLYR